MRSLENRLFPTGRLLLAVMLALLALTVLSGRPGAADDGPRQFLLSIYKKYSGPGAMGLDWRGNRASLYFDPAMTKLILRDVRESKGEVGRIGFDPFTAGQDFEIKGLGIEIVSQDGETAQAVASFRNLGQPAKIRYDLVKTAKGWRIANIVWIAPEDFKGDLRSILSGPL